MRGVAETKLKQWRVFFFLPVRLQSIIWEGGGNKMCIVGIPHEVPGCAVEEDKPSALLMLQRHRKYSNIRFTAAFLKWKFYHLKSGDVCLIFPFKKDLLLSHYFSRCHKRHLMFHSQKPALVSAFVCVLFYRENRKLL